MKDINKAFRRLQVSHTFLKNLQESGLNLVRSLEAAAKHHCVEVKTFYHVAMLIKDISDIVAIINPCREEAERIKEWLKNEFSVLENELGELRKLEKETAIPSTREGNDEEPVPSDG